MENIIKLNSVENEQALIQDLGVELKEITEGMVDWIYRYCDKSKIGKAILTDFIDYNKRQTSYSSEVDGAKKQEEIQFIFSKDLKYAGILSETQAFQALSIVLNDFDVKNKEASSLLENLFNKIIKTVNPVGETYEFTTAPYLYKSNSFKDGEHSYIDTITWVVSSILSYFRLYISGNIELNEETFNSAVKIYKICIQYILDSYIDNQTSKNKFKKGWNFTKDCDNPSLYFTFAVSEIMIDILSTFEDVIRSADIALLEEEIDAKLAGKTTQEDISAKKEQVREKYHEYTEVLSDGSEKGKREIQIFKLINNNLEVYDDNSAYKKLEEKVKDSARNIWNIVKDDVSDTFYSADLESNISEKAIEQSTSSDALFNSIFIINTIINAGLDEDAEDVINYFIKAGDENAYDEAVSEYDYMRDSFRIAYEKTWQFYRRLQKAGKEYKVSEYILSFDENFKNSTVNKIALELRKTRIHVFSLMPLLVKTKTVIGEFVIAYPQYDMQIYLEEILKNRYESQSMQRALWVWEKDGYSTSSNYYFISALGDFYSYYEKYEKPVIRNAANNREQRAKIRENAREEYLIELKKQGGEIYNLEKIIEQKDEEIAQLNKKYDDLVADSKAFLDDPLKYGLSLYIRDVMKEKIVEVLSADIVGSLLTGLSDKLTKESLSSVERKAEGIIAETMQKGEWFNKDGQDIDQSVAKLKQGISAFGKSLLSERVAEMRYTQKAQQIANVDKTPEKTVAVSQKDIIENTEYVADDIKQALRLYVKPILAVSKSEYVQTQGYEKLAKILREYNEDKK